MKHKKTVANISYECQKSRDGKLTWHFRLLWVICRISFALHKIYEWPVSFYSQEQDKSSDIEQQPSFGDRK